MIPISREEVAFLLGVLELPESVRKTLEKAKEKGCNLSEDDADTLRDLCGERLQTHGFEADYKANAEGAKLESLIDRLFVG